MLKLATKFKVQPNSIQAAVDAGFTCAEIWLDAKVLENWADVSRLATRSPLQFSLHFPNRGNLTDTHLSQAVELYHSLDCSAMVIHQPMMDLYGRSLLEIDPSIRLGVENHRLSPEDFQRWASSNRWLTLDVEHLWMLTLADCPLAQLLDSVRRFLERFHEKLIHVHLPGYLPGHDEHRPMYCSREMVLAVMNLLAEYRFEGLMVSEVNLDYQNPSELRMDVLLFNRWRQLAEDQARSAHVA